MKKCITLINESLNNLSKKEKEFAKFILSHKKEASAMNITELSKKSGISSATINRFCTSIGFSGYKEFIKEFYHEVLAEENKNINIYDIDDLSLNVTAKQAIQITCQRNADSILNTAEILDEESVIRAVNVIDKADKVAIYALSGSKVIGQDIYFKFIRLGINAQYYSDEHDQLLSRTVLGRNDVAIFVSYSGETKAIINSAEVIRKSEAHTISITKYGNNQLSKLCDINLQHASIGHGFKTYSTRSRAAQENIVDILFVLLCQKRKKYIQHYYNLVS